MYCKVRNLLRTWSQLSTPDTMLTCLFAVACRLRSPSRPAYLSALHGHGYMPGHKSFCTSALASVRPTETPDLLVEGSVATETGSRLGPGLGVGSQSCM